MVMRKNEMGQIDGRKLQGMFPGATLTYMRIDANCDEFRILHLNLMKVHAYILLGELNIYCLASLPHRF